MKDSGRIGDLVVASAGYGRSSDSLLRGRGWGTYTLYSEEGDILAEGGFENLITEVGDQFYGDRAAAIGTIDTVTGMRLGTGTTAVAKTGAGAAIVTYVTGSQKAIDGTWPQSTLSGSSRRIQWKTTWAAGEATANSIAEVVITNETPLTDVAGTAANTISRALLSPLVNKGASDTLAVTWNHDLLGA